MEEKEYLSSSADGTVSWQKGHGAVVIHKTKMKKSKREF